MNRDISIDILRFIALSGIILIHVGPGIFFSQLRSFDVPLMVFLSGVSYNLSSNQRGILSYKEYCIKRFKRLILPVWFFLPVYFLLYIVAKQEYPTLFQVVSYYSLLTNWYVWIIRVFFVIALFAPWVAFELNKVSNKTFYIWLGVVFILFELLVKYGQFTSSSLSVVFLTNIPYILIFAIGYKLLKLSVKQIIVLGSIFFVIYLLYAIYYLNINGGYVLTGKYKYPPQLYYTSYAMTVCLILWGIRRKILKFLGYLPKQIVQLFCFIGSHTMWIYLWHIPLVDAIGRSFSTSIRFIFVYTIALLITFIQCRFVYWVIGKLKSESFIKNIKVIFIG